MTVDYAAWGVDVGYEDVAGRWHDAPEDTLQAVATALGAHNSPAPRSDASVAAGASVVRVLQAGATAGLEVDGPFTVRLEDGAQVSGAGHLPAGLPLGYHDLIANDGSSVPLIVCPGACHPVDGPTWGWAVQLYAARSRHSWGIGDLGDLRYLAAWSEGLGAGAALLSPLHAAQPGYPQQPSPYSPSSRCFRNPIFLRVEDVRGAADVADLEGMAAAGRALNGDRLIDRDAVWRLKSAALETVFDRFVSRGGDADFDRWSAQLGPALSGYATYCALTEAHGRRWREWPVEVRHPEATGVAAMAADPEWTRRIDFHAWLQWLVDGQLANAGRQGVGLIQDLAIGCDPDGADAWLWQDAFALDMRVGAPPDEFNQAGQNWGLPPFDPWRLRRAAYQPFIQTVRAGLRPGGGLRFDHVMGLFRLYWIPEGRTAAQGTYVRYPWRELLDILALESVRAGAFVVGEDLGTVEPWVRQALADRGVLSYRLLWFEQEPPSKYPEAALAAVTTHDLPTVAGLWSGADLEDQRAAGLSPNEEATEASRVRLAGWAGLSDDAPVDDAVQGAHRLLAEAPSVILTATLDDALAVPDRPNLPGTTHERPNWSLALPVPLEEAVADPRCAEIAASLRRGIDGPPLG